MMALARGRLHWIVPAAALFAWLVILAFILPYDPDEAVYKIVAAGITDGRWPYRDLFDHKPPLIYAWYLPAGFGSSIEIERVIAAGALTASVPVVARIARRWLTGRQVPIAVASYALLLANPFFFAGANTEAFTLLPLTAAIAATSPLLAGMLLGAAVMTTPTAVVFFPLLVLIWRRDAWRAATGVAVVCALIALPFVPVWRDFWDANVRFIFEYGGTVSLSYRLRHMAAFPIPLLLGSLPLWCGALFGIVSCVKRRQWPVLVWAVCATIAVKSAGFDFGHYYLFVAPPVALLAGGGLDQMLRRRAYRIALSLGLGCSIGLFLIVFIVLLRASEPYRDVADAVRLQPGELYVLGDRSQIYVLADRQPERRYFFNVPLAVSASRAAEARASLIACPPELLVVPQTILFKVDWAGQVTELYSERRQFAHAILFSRPTRLCDLSRR